MSNLKVKGFDDLEKDPTSGAILLTPKVSPVGIKVDAILRKIKSLEKQNEEILQLLKQLTSSVSAQA